MFTSRPSAYSIATGKLKTVFKIPVASQTTADYSRPIDTGHDLTADLKATFHDSVIEFDRDTRVGAENGT